jgi:hypothetical protein
MNGVQYRQPTVERRYRPRRRRPPVWQIDGRSKGWRESHDGSVRSVEQSPSQGDRNGVSSATSPKLVDDILDVEINCGVRNRQFARNLLIANHFEELVAPLLAVVAARVVVSLPIRPAVLGCIHKHQSPGTHQPRHDRGNDAGG